MTSVSPRDDALHFHERMPPVMVTACGMDTMRTSNTLKT